MGGERRSVNWCLGRQDLGVSEGGGYMAPLAPGPALSYLTWALAARNPYQPFLVYARRQVLFELVSAVLVGIPKSECCPRCVFERSCGLVGVVWFVDCIMVS